MARRTPRDWAALEAQYPSLAQARRHDLADFCEKYPSKYQEVLRRTVLVEQKTWHDIGRTIDLAGATELDTYHTAVLQGILLSCKWLEDTPCEIFHADAIAFECGVPDWSAARLKSLELSAADDVVKMKERMQ